MVLRDSLVKGDRIITNFIEFKVSLMMMFVFQQ